MSTMQRLTLIGIYDYDPTLFDNLTLPDGYDKQTFIDSLLLEHGEKCVLYSNPEFMKFSISAWGRKWALELERIYKALSAEYDPIFNYDRYEEYTDNEGRKYTSEQSAGHTATDSPDFNITNENTISADNSGTYQPQDKSTTDTKGKTQDLSEESTSNTSDSEERELNHKAHLYGNIGVTTSVQMWSEEVRARMQYNLYDAATRLFANELLIGIY